MIHNNKKQRLEDTIHDIRSPLNNISMHAEIAKLALNNELPAEQGRASLEAIIANCKTCSELLQALVEP
ncbi:histidine kinase [Alteromonas sediminis]|uniref:histidine kinase n=1 Tax=Alteromonas sediminis TaxID=2259342 RepID=A0A3N5Y898_9ALTE|nr:histidine kinase dimerization/phospho-acceptor domain-containing protein [Alteromonas sediminis]RPJ67239.1 histidine kinase [Alteromonas sediminis]